MIQTNDREVLITVVAICYVYVCTLYTHHHVCLHTHICYNTCMHVIDVYNMVYVYVLYVNVCVIFVMYVHVMLCVVMCMLHV